MKFIKTNGIVLREIPTVDADKHLLVLSPEHGKLNLFAQGAKRPRSRFLGCSQWLCYSELQLYRSKESFRLSECRTLEAFFDIRQDIHKLTLCTYFCEVLLDFLMEDVSAYEETRLFLNALHFLEKDKKDPKLIVSIFQLRLLSLHGFSPQTKCCASCQTQESHARYFSFNECSFYCSNCASKGLSLQKVPVSEGLFLLVNHTVKAPFEKLFHFQITQEVIDEMFTWSHRYFMERLERTYPSYTMWLNMIEP